jgi:hypothetical protein
MVSVAQRLEHWTVAPGVEGSNPFTHPIFFVRYYHFGTRIVAAEYSLFGPLAQLVEQLTLNQRVRSSSLRRPTKIFLAPTLSLLPRVGDREPFG